MCQLFVSWLKIISIATPPKNNVKYNYWKMAIWLNSVWYRIWGIQKTQTQWAGAN